MLLKLKTVQRVFLFVFCCCLQSNLLFGNETSINENDEEIVQTIVTGNVTDPGGEMPLPGVTVRVKGTTTGVVTDFDGNYSIEAPSNSTLVFSYVGFTTVEIPVDGQSSIDVMMEEDISSLDEVVVTGYGTQEKKAITGAISTVTSEDLDRVRGGSTVSSGLAGKIPGVSFRMADGRPGAGAAIQIRNMGTPLFVIDGIQQDEGQFNNLAPGDIESLTVLKDASAAIYGVKAANGVVVVTTKRGKRSTKSTVSINAYTGWQNWSRFPKAVNDSYTYVRAQAEAEVNEFGSTGITQGELDRYKAGTEEGYKSFDWRDFIIKDNAPMTSVQASASGGSENINYYFSATDLSQQAVLGDQFTFDRKNIQSNVEANITDRLKVGVQINGRIEIRENPGIPGEDDYWLPRFALLRNRPYERPFANDNPEYLNDIGHNETNWGLHNFDVGGYKLDKWRVLQNNFSAEYDLPFIDGLTLSGMYSYYIADHVMDGHEYTYEAYTYHPEDDTYEVTGGSTNPWREREQNKVIRNIYQGQLHYQRDFGDHDVDAMFIVERQETMNTRNWVHSVPGTNTLPLIYFSDVDTYDDSASEEARIGYIGRLSYNFRDKYYVELSGRQDASWRFAPGKRTGFFPSASVGWRLTEEDFMKDLLGESTVLNDLKLRGSYGILGDDNINLGIGAGDARYIGPYAYLPGYTYNAGVAILDGKPVITSRDRGQVIDNISWFKSKITNIGVDAYLFDHKLSATFDYFHRLRTDLRGAKYDILIPNELGYSLPDENVNSDAQYGVEGSLAYTDTFGDFTVSIGANASLSRSKFMSSYRPRFNNSWDHYRHSGEHRFNTNFWGYEAIGQFQTQEEIDNYHVNIDGRGNETLLPGDIIYKDINGDGKIDGYDERPIGYNSYNPMINMGLNIYVAYKGFDFAADFSGASGYSYNQEWETRIPFQNTGALNEIFLDRWHRADIFDPNSEWIPGKYPALRYNNSTHSNYNKNSTFWLHNVTYLRARTIELGYTLPESLLSRLKLQNARVYVNGYNLFSIDNVKDFSIDPEVSDSNGLQYPQSKYINVGVNLSI